MHTVFKRSPLLASRVDDAKKLVTEFQTHQSHIPTYGALILDARLTRVFLVVPSCNKALGFPKGKRAEGEAPYDSAWREVREETDIDIRAHSSPRVSLHHNNLTVFVCVFSLSPQHPFAFIVPPPGRCRLPPLCPCQSAHSG